jgi:hypothetical protein
MSDTTTSWKIGEVLRSMSVGSNLDAPALAERLDAPLNQVSSTLSNLRKLGYLEEEGMYNGYTIYKLAKSIEDYNFRKTPPTFSGKVPLAPVWERLFAIASELEIAKPDLRLVETKDLAAELNRRLR